MLNPKIKLIAASACALLMSACGGGKTTEPVKAGPSAQSAPLTPATKIAQEKFIKAAAEFKESQKTGTPDYASLENQFRDVVKTDPSFAEAYYDLGVIAEKQNKPDEAMKNYQSALKANPKYAPAVQNQAVLLVAQGKEDDAMRMLESFIKEEPAAAGPKVQLAQLYQARKRYDEAENQCRAALQREPKNLPAFETLAMVYVDDGNRPMAKLVAARGFKVDDKSAALHYTIGRIYLQENKIPEAVAEMKAALAARPSFRPARVDLAEVSLQYRDFGNAKTYFGDLVKADSKDEPSWIGLGIANKGLGQYEEAKAAYNTVLASDPKNSVALLDMAILYHRHLNDFATAVKYYQSYLEHPADDGPKVEQVKGWVNELEQTIAALKEAEKLQQMEDAKVKEQPARDATPASGPTDAPTK